MIDTVKTQVEVTAPRFKKAYQTPELVAYGTVADLTANSNTTGATPDVPKAGLRSS